MSEASSYASSISVEISSTSSIPDENSQLIMGAKPEKGKVLRGFQPTEFFILLTPSVFLSTVSDWESLMTGYHISP